jgi:ferric-dicitrate binding protein FerR (iron transport regulator)
MKHYLQYTELELSLDQDFIDWIKLGKNDAAWKELSKSTPEFGERIEQARELVQQLGFAPVKLDDFEINAEINRLFDKIQPVQPEVVQRKGSSKILRWILGAVAAAALVLLWFGWMEESQLKPAENYAELTAFKKLIEHINSTDSSIRFALPDSSTVALSPGSRFSYASGFTDSATRDIYLSGEAFFEVRKNADKPFRVFSNNLVTRVLGTSFLVRAFETEKDINVVVRSGKVNVFHLQQEGVLLTANQQAVFSKKKKSLIKKLTDNPVIIRPDIKTGQLKFEDRPVSDVLEMLKVAYGLDINYDAERLKGCSITADLSEETIYKKLDLICRVINADYEIINSEVYIYPKGCN